MAPAGLTATADGGPPAKTRFTAVRTRSAVSIRPGLGAWFLVVGWGTVGPPVEDVFRTGGGPGTGSVTSAPDVIYIT
ncbi:hypothetical protein UK15_36205 [Streptomyces variegatus]|uniref:Uncharacterized protein n=1 Tax=Streptomyces variegatus TaxID=284040 RepID=A0A0M2GG05_9ACTN|nr:hypothetical protein UK15_36205 [Streptomyces variegatus]